MKKTIKISIDPKKRFGVMAKPGEITFGTHTHLITQEAKKTTFENLIIEAHKKARATKTKRLALERINSKSINAKIARLRHIEATRELHELNRLIALREYRELQKEYKNKTINDPKEFIVQKNRIYLLAQRVKFIEALIDKNEIEAKKARTDIAQSLLIPTRAKSTKVQSVAKKRKLNQTAKNEIDNLLDLISKNKARQAEILAELEKTSFSNRNRIAKLREELSIIEVNLNYLPMLIQKEENGDFSRRKETRVERAKKREQNALKEYAKTQKLLKHTHPQVTEMRIEYLKAKQSRLYEEGRLAADNRQREKIDAELVKLEAEINKMKKEIEN